MDYDDDRTVIQTEEDRKRLEREILGEFAGEDIENDVAQED